MPVSCITRTTAHCGHYGRPVSQIRMPLRSILRVATQDTDSRADSADEIAAQLHGRLIQHAMHSAGTWVHGRKSRWRKQANASRCILTFQTYWIQRSARQSAGSHISNFHPENLDETTISYVTRHGFQLASVSRHLNRKTDARDYRWYTARSCQIQACASAPFVYISVTKGR